MTRGDVRENTKREGMLTTIGGSGADCDLISFASYKRSKTILYFD